MTRSLGIAARATPDPGSSGSQIRIGVFEVSKRKISFANEHHFGTIGFFEPWSAVDLTCSQHDFGDTPMRKILLATAAMAIMCGSALAQMGDGMDKPGMSSSMNSNARMMRHHKMKHHMMKKKMMKDGMMDNGKM